MLKMTGMSETEIRFVHAYVRALKRDYDMVKTVLELMNPDTLAVSDIVRATQLATDLDGFFENFEHKLHVLDAKHKFLHAKTPPWPPMDELADLFSLSFFKVITKTSGAKKQDAGWFSGEPDHWAGILNDPISAMHQNMLSSLPETFFTDLTKAAKKLFGGPSFFAELFGQFKSPPNAWPMPDEYDIQDELYDDEDDEDYT